MANDQTGEFQWIIDTAAATDLSLASSPDAKPVRLKLAALRYVSNTASAGDSVIVKDGAGKTIWETRATGAQYVEESRVPLEATGIAVTTLTSGKLYIYFSPYDATRR